MTNPTTTPGSDTGESLQERAEQTLQAHAARSEHQLHELESDMVGLLGDSGTIQEDRDGSRRLIESVRADLERTRRALARIEAGTFGQCTKCREPIADARLEAIPEADYCTNCA